VSNPRWRLGVAPLALFYAVFFLLPQIAFLAVSVFRSTGPGQIGPAFTFENYQAILGNAFFRRAIVNTLELSTVTALGSVLLGFPIAYAIAQSPRYGKLLFALVIAIMFSSAVALALGWQTLLASSGGINGLLATLGWISEPLPLSANFTSIAIGTVHGAIPVAVIGILPACEGIPARQLEVSVGLGASRWCTFWNVIFPQTYRSVVSMALIVFAITTSIFTTPALLGGGQVALVPLAIREQLLTLFDYPKSAALATTLIVITLVIMALSHLVMRAGQPHPAAGRAR
jgi:putative spermidine/putrescine transport system permease protein